MCREVSHRWRSICRVSTTFFFLFLRLEARLKINLDEKKARDDPFLSYPRG